MPRPVSRAPVEDLPPEVPSTSLGVSGGPVHAERSRGTNSPPRDRLEAFPSGPVGAAPDSTLQHVLRSKPALADRLPGHLQSPSAKLLYVATHRELARGLSFSVPIGSHDSIRLEPDGGLTLSSPGSRAVRLHNRHDDLARLLGGAQAYDALETTSLDTLLREAVHRFYVEGRFDGGGAAVSERGSRAFTFATIQQVLVSPDPSARGLECLASAAVHLWKSMGLVPPELTREEFEHRFTSIHGERGGTRLGPEFNKTLRGGRSDVRLDAAATADFANALRADDWAKLTGASNGRYFVRALPNVEAVVKHFAQGGAGVRTTWADGGHYFVLSGAREIEGQLFVNEDDSLRGAPATRKNETDEPYRTPFDERYHTRFWTLDRG